MGAQMAFCNACLGEPRSETAMDRSASSSPSSEVFSSLLRGQKMVRSEERRITREAYNLFEVDIFQKFDEWDQDHSGFLERSEVVEMMKDVGGKTPEPDEVAWLMKVADRDDDGKINRRELLIALQAWHGYTHLPKELVDLFEQFDTNGDQYLQFPELKGLLTKVNNREVSDLEVHQVMEVADLISDGRIGRYELLGALGAWYVSVGREPTPAMALAFLTNNRTGGLIHTLVHWSMAVILFVSAYFPLRAAIGANHCKMDLHSILTADAVLWVFFTFVVLMKGHWVELTNCTLGPERAMRRLRTLSWSTMLFEVSTLMALTTVEAIGFWYVLKEEYAGKAELEACERNATLPLDIPLSFRSGAIKRYPSYIEFCQMWFTFNFAFNLVTILAYYAYLGWRFYKTVQVEKKLQAEHDGTDGVLSKDHGPTEVVPLVSDFDLKAQP